MVNREREILRKLLPSELAKACEERSPQFGKTAFMKLAYILQEVYGVPLGYRFTLYTYGPYCSEVLADLDRAQLQGRVDIRYEDDAPGFRISPGSQSNERVRDGEVFDSYREQIELVVSTFGGFSARELELRTTITYLWNAIQETEGSVSDDDIVVKAVKQLKPHFRTAEIHAATIELKRNQAVRSDECVETT